MQLIVTILISLYGSIDTFIISILFTAIFINIVWVFLQIDYTVAMYKILAYIFEKSYNRLLKTLVICLDNILQSIYFVIYIINNCI